jgi:hypothetical protein
VGRNLLALGLLAALVAGAGEAGAQAVAVKTPAPTSSPGAAPAAADSAPGDSAVTDSARKAREVQVTREAFVYGGGSRDPFASLINSARSGPELGELQLVGVYENLRDRSRSVVVLREKVGGKRHKMWVGDQLGRLRLVQIRPRDAVFLIQDFGFERQETLSLRKQEEATP